MPFTQAVLSWHRSKILVTLLLSSNRSGKYVSRSHTVKTPRRSSCFALVSPIPLSNLISVSRGLITKHHSLDILFNRNNIVINALTAVCNKDVGIREFFFDCICNFLRIILGFILSVVESNNFTVICCDLIYK